VVAVRGAETANRSFGENLVQIGKALDLDGIAAGVAEEHGGLLAGLALEADAEIWWPKKSKSTQVSVLRPSWQPSSVP
jgi:hypothetical protein